MISNFFVLSPRGDTILAKQYRINDHILKGDAKEVGAHERSHTEAFFRKIKFWDDMTTNGTITTSDDEALLDNTSTTPHNGGSNGQTHHDPNDPGTSKQQSGHEKGKRKYDAPPVFPMPDGYTYFHIKRNGLIFGASSVRNVSPNTVLEVR
jgi:AP-4 complex subunit mu-1